MIENLIPWGWNGSKFEKYSSNEKIQIKQNCYRIYSSKKGLFNEWHRIENLTQQKYIDDIKINEPRVYVLRPQSEHDYGIYIKLTFLQKLKFILNTLPYRFDAFIKKYGGFILDVMKKFILSALFVCAAIIGFTSCGPQPNTNGDVKFITLHKTEIIISELGSERLTATTDPAGQQITWKSSNTEVATVAQNGLVTAAGVGTCTITASCGDKTATCEVEVASYFDPRVVSVEAFLTMQAEKTGETFTSETSGNTYEWTNFTFLLMTNGMAYDREADDFIGPDQCPAFLIMGLGASDDQYIYILGDWDAAEAPLSEASTFEAGSIRNDTIYGSYMTECVMGAEGYQFGNIYGVINMGSSFCMDQNSVVPRCHLDITLGNDENVVYDKQGSASFDEYSIDGIFCIRIPWNSVEKQINVAKKLTDNKKF